MGLCLLCYSLEALYVSMSKVHYNCWYRTFFNKRTFGGEIILKESKSDKHILDDIQKECEMFLTIDLCESGYALRDSILAILKERKLS